MRELCAWTIHATHVTANKRTAFVLWAWDHDNIPVRAQLEMSRRGLHDYVLWTYRRKDQDMSYVTKLQNGADFQDVVDDIRQRLHSAGDQIGRQLVGTLPSGESVLFQRAFFAEDSMVTLSHPKTGLRKIESSDVDALKLIDEKLARI